MLRDGPHQKVAGAVPGLFQGGKGSGFDLGFVSSRVRWSNFLLDPQGFIPGCAVGVHDDLSVVKGQLNTMSLHRKQIAVGFDRKKSLIFMSLHQLPVRRLKECYTNC